MSRLIIAAAVSLTVAGTADAEAPLVAAVESGKLQGTAEGQVLSWKGIPFAAPPVGDLRWRAPQPVAPWSGVRMADAYGHDCMQKPFDGDAAPLGTPPAEDCLYANVWRPAQAQGKLPVVVWIYGGGFVNGGASPPTYSGAQLAKQGVLFFSFNYCVGRFGTFAHPALIRADEDHGLIGNYGFLDQIAALAWVQRNIEAFGGDPENVTIIGESAGGMSVHNLVTSPMAEGLFEKAVAMSGSNGTALSTPDLASAEAVSVAFGQSKGIAADDPEALAKLRALPADEVVDGLNLMALFMPKGPVTFASPFSDGRIAVDQRAAYKAGKFDHVPMIIGATSDDIGGIGGGMIAGARELSGIISQHGAPVWEYRFSYVASSLEQGKGAGHASDIPYFFDTQAVKYAAETSARDDAMGRTISAYMVNFAKTGDPNGAGLPQWPQQKADPAAIMDFAPDGTAQYGPDPWRDQIEDALAASGN
ncbi:carboxylesterase/lipase family protein [Novosphingobium beihaiensis]|uniref:Carboxylic ester hydrolase n=1 Tax=Novosphingobium beihaiensis TaxID=2930389 RepID=A0ABT0BJQ5_9SPHN|nr:carboxylesterase family protein [Novosphingobium beihaiensis]MCJ2185275.1 carboxylesterase family protein [Novosphingobium beihaiensis]